MQAVSPLNTLRELLNTMRAALGEDRAGSTTDASQGAAEDQDALALALQAFIEAWQPRTAALTQAEAGLAQIPGRLTSTWRQALVEL
jgi:hypothetical protein